MLQIWLRLASNKCTALARPTMLFVDFQNIWLSSVECGGKECLPRKPQQRLSVGEGLNKCQKLPVGLVDFLEGSSFSVCLWARIWFKWSTLSPQEAEDTFRQETTGEREQVEGGHFVPFALETESQMDCHRNRTATHQSCVMIPLI